MSLMGIENSPTSRLRQSACFFICFLLFLMVFRFQVSADTTVLSVQPQASVIWGADAELKVNVTVTDVTDLYGWQFSLYYDSTLLNGTGVSEGPLLKSGGNTKFFNFFFGDNYNSTHGLVTAGCSLLGKIPGVSGKRSACNNHLQDKGVG